MDHARGAPWAGGLVLLAADIPTTLDCAALAGLSVSLSGQDGAALAQAPWGASFGMLTGRSGVGWMVDIGTTG
ncbi:hypothetical protein [Arthrobacter sp. JSM 101049]|uniref:hypothetical protein n=1 Tax=Arthrobacter sp. JSM 101049 TaxID=929097 RepID=UPI0035643DA5